MFVSSSEEIHRLVSTACPACGRAIITLEPGVVKEENSALKFEPSNELLAWPVSSVRPVPPQVPEQIAEDYNEAALILQLSPKASAALSRRCLQAVLRDAGYNQHDLAKQIDAVLPHLPSYIAGDVDAIRQLGNFAAHPMKSEASGEIVDVEPHEAEWNLDVLDQLFDFFYVLPAIAQRKRDALNEKLSAVGKPPMK